MPTEELTPASTGLRQLRVLLVEDNADDALLLDRHLRRSGFSVTMLRVETAPEMRGALANAAGYDVVLADYNLPLFSGPAALQMLKASRLDIPFIMMSGAISEDTAVESMRAGAQDYVTKQNLTRLVPALERELKEAGARRGRLAAETALRDSEARFHRLVESMPLGLLISNSGGQVVYANAAIERLMGYTADQLASETIMLHALLPKLSSLVSCGSMNVAMQPVEGVGVTASGRTIEVLVGAAVLNPEALPEECQIAAFVADLSLQKKSEEVLRRTEKLAVAGRFAASIAHEINNPLEAITNCMYLLGRTQLEADGRSYLEMAQRELNRVTQITMHTLRFHRASTRPVETDLNELLESVLVLFESRVRQAEVSVQREYGQGAKVIGYDGEIRQVIVNLIGNAVDALVSGGKLLVRTSRSHEWRSGQVGVRVTVADTGVGMDQATRARIFEAFFSTKGITGTGLGLWVSQDIVARHGGRLSVRSRQRTDKDSGGTVFSLFIPLEIDHVVPGQVE